MILPLRWCCIGSFAARQQWTALIRLISMDEAEVLFFRGFARWAQAAAGVVDQNVEAAPFAHDAVDDLGGSGLLRHIGLYAEGAAAEVADFVDDRVRAQLLVVLLGRG